MTDTLLPLLETFIAFRSIAGENDVKRECLAWIEETFLSDAGKTAVRGDNAGAPYIYFPHPGAKILWFAHTDVVPCKDEMFTLTVEGDRAVGRGVKDMKGAALPFFLAFREACATGDRPPVSILLTSDEEIGGKTIPLLLEQHTIDVPVAFTPDSGSNPHIVTEHKGAVWADLTAHGDGTHGAMPWEGRNPFMLLSDALLRLSIAFPAGDETEWHMTVSPTEARGSDAKNKVPDTAHVTLDIRFPPEICKTADEAIAMVTKELPDGCTLTSFVDADPIFIDPAHPMVQTIQRLAQDVIGSPVPIGREHGATDARFFAAAGIPAFLYGPVGGGIHTELEWVSIESLQQQYEISKRLLQELSV